MSASAALCGYRPQGKSLPEGHPGKCALRGALSQAVKDGHSVTEECKATAYLIPKGNRGQQHAARKAGWDKYLIPSLSANPYRVKARLPEFQPSGLGVTRAFMVLLGSYDNLK